MPAPRIPAMFDNVSIPTLLLLAGAGYVAWLISILSGGGGALLLIPVLTWTLGPRAVAPVIAMVTLFDAPVRLRLFWQHVRWDVVRWYLPGAIAGALIGTFLFDRLAETQAHWLKILVGLFLISTVFQYAFGKRERSFRMRVWAFTPIGFVAALVSGVIGEAGPVLNPFYLNYGVQKEEMIGTKSFNSIGMQTTKLAGYFAFGVLLREFLIYGVVIGVAAAMASWTGKKMLGKMRSQLFRQMVIGVMVVTGCILLWEERHVFLK
jgi:uncharacterized membrane protein YfcA